MDSWYRHGLMVYIATHGFLYGVMVYIWTHGTKNTHGTNSDSCYSIETPTSQTHERAECCPYTGFLLPFPKKYTFLLENIYQKEWQQITRAQGHRQV